jgi:hypothetical protein
LSEPLLPLDGLEADAMLGAVECFEPEALEPESFAALEAREPECLPPDSLEPESLEAESFELESLEPLESEAFVPALEPLVDALEARESVLYQPLPLKTMPTG